MRRGERWFGGKQAEGVKAAQESLNSGGCRGSMSFFAVPSAAGEPTRNLQGGPEAASRLPKQRERSGSWPRGAMQDGGSNGRVRISELLFVEAISSVFAAIHRCCEAHSRLSSPLCTEL